MNLGKAHISRRRFLEAFLCSFRSGRKDGVTRFDDGSFLVEHGCLSCAGQRRVDGEWDLEFTVWHTTRIIPSMESIERMNPTGVLRAALAAAGIPTEIGGHPVYRSLVGQMPAHTKPVDLMHCMKKICRALPVMDLGCRILEEGSTSASGGDGRPS